MKFQGTVPPFGEVDVPDAASVKVRLVLVDGFRTDLEDVPSDDIDLWLATKMVSYRSGDARMFHPMSAVTTIVVFDE